MLEIKQIQNGRHLERHYDAQCKSERKLHFLIYQLLVILQTIFYWLNLHYLDQGTQ